MNLTIKSRTAGNFTFWMNSNGGHIFIESEGKPGTLGQQVCKGGKLTGSTLSATPENFEKTCRNWYRSHTKPVSYE